MALNNLKDVYLDQIQDIYSACKQSIEATTKLGQASKDDELGKALAAGSKGIAEGMEKLERICSDHGIDPNGEHCKGMEGLVAEARKHAIETECMGKRQTENRPTTGTQQREEEERIADGEQ